VLLTEICERINIQRVGIDEEPVRFHSVLSLLSYLCKAPQVPAGAPVINALFKQREAVINVFRACIGLAPENHMLMEHRLEAPIAVAAGCCVPDAAETVVDKVMDSRDPTAATVILG